MNHIHVFLAGCSPSALTLLTLALAIVAQAWAIVAQVWAMVAQAWAMVAQAWAMVAQAWAMVALPMMPLAVVALALYIYTAAVFKWCDCQWRYNNTVYVAESGYSSIKIFSISGACHQILATFGGGQLSSPCGII